MIIFEIKLLLLLIFNESKILPIELFFTNIPWLIAVFFFRSKPHNIAKRENTLERMSIVGFRVESSDKSTEVDEGVPVIRAGTNAKIRLFGHGFTDETIIGLTAEKLNFGDSCRMMIPTGVFKLFREKNSTTNGLVDILLPEHSVELFFCAKNDDNV